MMKESENKGLSPGKIAEHVLQEAVADAIEEYRHRQIPIVVMRDGKVTEVDPNKIKTVRDGRSSYDIINKK